jgi:cAMP phosphodiesterase
MNELDKLRILQVEANMVFNNVGWPSITKVRQDIRKIRVIDLSQVNRLLRTNYYL